MDIKNVIAVAACSVALTACGGGGGKKNTSPSSSSTSSSAVISSSPISSSSSSVALLSGRLVDSEVANVSYSTATQRGVTNENGIFYYLEGETITFSIGELTFPAIPAAALLTPLDLAGAEDINDPRVINIARLLQTIDSDGDPSNGILVSEVAIAAMQSLDFSLPVDDFANQAGITALLTAIDKAELVAPDSAIDHLRDTLNGGSSSSLSSSSVVPATSSAISSSSSAISSSRSSVVSSVSSATSSSASSGPIVPVSSVPSSVASSSLPASSSSVASSAPVSSSSVVSSVPASSSSVSSSISSPISSSSASSGLPLGDPIIGTSVRPDYSRNGALTVSWAAVANSGRVQVHASTDTSATTIEEMLANISVYRSVDTTGNVTQAEFRDLVTGQTYYFIVEVETGGLRRLSPRVSGVAQPALAITTKLNDTGNNTRHMRDNSGLGITGIDVTATESIAFPYQDSRHGRDITVTSAQKTGTGLAGFDFSYLGGDGTVTDAAQAQCVRDNVTGLVWELKTSTNYNHTYVWKPASFANSSSYGSRGYFGKVLDLTDVNSACTSGTPSTACTVQDFIDEINTATLCGASDWGLPTATQLESIISLHTNTDSTAQFYRPNREMSRAFTIDPVFNKGSTLFPHLVSETPYWTASVGRDSPAVVDFTSGEVKFNWHNQTTTVENARHAVRLVRNGKQ